MAESMFANKDQIVRRKPNTVMVPASLVVTKYGAYVQMWMGSGHEERANRQTLALNAYHGEDTHKVEAIWVERPATLRNG